MWQRATECTDLWLQVLSSKSDGTVDVLPVKPLLQDGSVI